MNFFPPHTDIMLFQLKKLLQDKFNITYGILTLTNKEKEKRIFMTTSLLNAGIINIMAQAFVMEE